VLSRAEPDVSAKPPIVVVLAGPNGAGKTTASEAFLRDELAVTDFVNADAIARGLSGFGAQGVAFAAGRILLSRLDELARRRADFAFETTLASRTFAPWLARRVREGFELHLCFGWLPSPELAIARVAARVEAGGHDIPVDSIRRRYVRGIRNLFELYLPIATRWTILHAGALVPTTIASGGAGRPNEVLDASAWSRLSSSTR
jgi:predicted ABC-type ATPase